jgi:pyruvate dehydrogenase E1 component alpha subunit
MHVADMSVGMLGANGIVGAGVPIALGSALANRVLKRDAIAVAFFGDGALAEGAIHESFNLAALWSLPLLLVCENNGYGEFLPTSKQLSFKLENFAACYGIPYRQVDGNDVEAVAAASEAAISGVREGGGPSVLEFMTTRIRGHYEGDAQKYRDAAELAGLDALDPLKRTALRLETLGIATDELAAIAADVDARIVEAVDAARQSPAPSFIAAVADFYTQGAIV